MEALFGPENCMYLARILAWLFAVPLHEVCHGFVSCKLGDNTAKSAGRLTLNPLRHIDPLGLLSMLFIGVGWAKPVPVNPAFYKNRKTGMALTALAGPLSNLVLAFAVILPLRLFGRLAAANFGGGLSAWPLWAGAAYQVVYYFTVINVTLALFNLLPVPPLDGSRILGLLLPERAYFGIMRYERYIMMVLLAAMLILPRVFGISPLGWLIGPASGAVMDALWRCADFMALITF